MNKPPYIVTPTAISIVWNGKSHIVNNDNPNYPLLKAALFNAEYDKIPNYLEIEKRIENFSHGNLRVKDGEVFYGQYKLTGIVIDKLLQFLRQGMKDAKPILNFIDRLMANPSSNSVEQLYTFLSYKLLPLTEDGKIIAYKGVASDYYSHSGNKQTVVLQGTVDDGGRILNKVGETIEVLRRSVDDNKDNHCSRGLHAGSFDYASDFMGCGGHLMMVEFDPADAVSVPTDCNFQKLRVCKYRVIGEIDIKEDEELDGACYNTDKEEIEVSDGDDEECPDCGEIICDCYDPDDYEPEESEEKGKCVAGCCDTKHNEKYVNLYSKIENYVVNKCAWGDAPTLKQIQSRLKGDSITCRELVEICEDFGFTVESDEDVPLSLWRVSNNRE